jgi:pyruvate,orthophosphate dikinase
MFFDEARIQAVREMILAEQVETRRNALAKLLPMQRGDFVELFEIMKGLPVTILLLDPPLHEFLPHGEEDIAEVAAAMGADPKKLEHRAKELAEFNPMLGFRGCRIAIAYPEIAEMQARAIFEAAVEAGKRTGKPVKPEVMVPLIATKAELDIVKERIDAMAQAVKKETGAKLDYQVGTMIELPRAALLADQIAESAEFFSFGTNDLTQTTFGISRDDAASFLGIYTARGILPGDPFVSIDQEGVGALVRIGVERGRKVRRNLKVGICGEHGGDPASVAFCHQVGLDYVSCSPFRVPFARLAGAPAALGAKAAGVALGAGFGGDHETTRAFGSDREKPLCQGQRRPPSLSDGRPGRSGDPAARLCADQPHVASVDRGVGQDPHRDRARPAWLRSIRQTGGRLRKSIHGARHPCARGFAWIQADSSLRSRHRADGGLRLRGAISR